LTEAVVDLATALERLDREIEARPGGLPEELFRFLSRVTPLVNVDLLVQDEERRTLLTWRHDEFYGPGWHVPGGVIRFQETAATRVDATALAELGASVSFDPAPARVIECITTGRRERGHFVSLLYRCRLTGSPDAGRRHRGGVPLPGQWAWHEHCPRDLIAEHRPYADLMG
jgi:colanic acid biosynthesis protein WcaH